MTRTALPILRWREANKMKETLKIRLHGRELTIGSLTWGPRSLKQGEGTGNRESGHLRAFGVWGPLGSFRTRKYHASPDLSETRIKPI